MNYLYPDCFDDLIEPVQKVLAYREYDEKVTPDCLKGIPTIIKTWEQHKSRFYHSKAFNERLIVEIADVTVHLDADRKQSLFEKFLDILTDDWEEIFYGFEEYADEARDLSEFYWANRDRFFENKTAVQWEAPDGTIIMENNKISKSIKHFFDNSELVRILQDKYSELVQQDKISGTLCASIHPLDFLSSSENNYKWRSCHALNGEYANGNLSYMLDDCTIMFYIKGADEAKLPRFPDDILWNDKKWRMLAFIDQKDRFFFAGRQYPFFSNELLNETHNFLSACVSASSAKYFYNWSNKYLNHAMGYFTDDTHNMVEFDEDYLLTPRGTCITRGDLIQDAKKSTHFNDLTHSSVYIPYYAFSMEDLVLRPIKPMIVGHMPICTCCGEEKHIHSDKFICSDCDVALHPFICSCCGKETTSITWVSGYGEICNDCVSKHTWVCSQCGDLVSDKKTECVCNLLTRTRNEYSAINNIDETFAIANIF